MGILDSANVGATRIAEVDGKVSLDDIEQRLRSLTGTAREALGESKQNATVAAVLGGVAALALVYLLGRRRGRRRATVLEIRRG